MVGGSWSWSLVRGSSFMVYGPYSVVVVIVGGRRRCRGSWSLVRDRGSWSVLDGHSPGPWYVVGGRGRWSWSWSWSVVIGPWWVVVVVVGGRWSVVLVGGRGRGRGPCQRGLHGQSCADTPYVFDSYGVLS
ncbi:hypothetical protein Tco_0885177 [Tanacetum coccineum]